MILSELGESVDSPDDLVHDHLFEAAFDGQAIGRPVLGSEATVRAVTRQDCCDWLEQQFVPVAAGARRERQGRPGRSARSSRSGCSATWRRAKRRQSSRRTSPAASGTIAEASSRRIGASPSQGSPAADPRNPALALFVQALGGGTSSRLFQELREERGLAYSIYAWSQAFADTGLVGIGCAAERRQAAESVQLARDVLGATAEGLTEAELNRARAQIEAGLLMALETPQGRADQMARSIEVFGRIVPLDELLDQIRGVTVEDARAAGAALLDGPVAVASVGAKLALAA